MSPRFDVTHIKLAWYSTITFLRSVGYLIDYNSIGHSNVKGLCFNCAFVKHTPYQPSIIEGLAGAAINLNLGDPTSSVSTPG